MVYVKNIEIEASVDGNITNEKIGVENMDKVDDVKG
jgi:hypothetical protein